MKVFPGCSIWRSVLQTCLPVITHGLMGFSPLPQRTCPNTHQSIQTALSFDRTITFTFVDQRTPLTSRCPVLQRNRIVRPLKIRSLIIQGHPTSLFRSCAFGEDPDMDQLHASLVRSFNPEEFRLVSLDTSWHCRTDICSTFERHPTHRGWSRLKRVRFQGASLYSPLRSTSFGHSAWPKETGWDVIFEVQSACHPKQVLSKTHQVEWLNNLAWHVFQRDGPGWGRYPSFPSKAIRRIIVMVKSTSDLVDAETTLLCLAEQILGRQAGTDRLRFIDIRVGRVGSV